MATTLLYLAPFLLQGLVLAFDEFWFHHRRDLGPWERLGHPVDTATFLMCLVYPLAAAPSTGTLVGYVVLAICSCLMVSKDEWEHQRRCDAFENWLHALLFMMHPCLLIWAGHLWWSANPAAGVVIASAVTSVATFLGYQIIYWNFWRPRA